MQRRASSSGKSSASTKALRGFGLPSRPTRAVRMRASSSPPASVQTSSPLLDIQFLVFHSFSLSYLYSRGAHHASALLALIDRFPRKNPRPDEEGVDMSAQLRLIRSRYKAMCASLGVRARLRPAPSAGAQHGLDTSEPDADSGAGKRQRPNTVWPHTGPSASASAQGLSF